MKNLYSRTKFNACHKYLRKQLADFSDKFGRLKASAVLLYEREHVRSLTICDDGMKLLQKLIISLQHAANRLISHYF